MAYACGRCGVWLGDPHQTLNTPVLCDHKKPARWTVSVLRTSAPEVKEVSDGR